MEPQEQPGDAIRVCVVLLGIRRTRAWLAPVVIGVLLGGCGVFGIAAPQCDGVSEALCHAAHTVAEMHGLFLQPGQHVVSWIVRPSAAKACAETGPARADVKFKIDPPPGIVTVTVAESSNGALAVCLY